MHQRLAFLVIAVLCVALLLSGCTSSADIPADSALSVIGQVRRPTGWTIEALRDIEPMRAMAPCADSGRDKEFKGPSLNALLDEAKPRRGASEVVFAGAEGYTAIVSLDVVRQTSDAIVAVTDKGKCRLILPGQPEDKQVLGLTKIEIR